MYGGGEVEMGSDRRKLLERTRSAYIDGKRVPLDFSLDAAVLPG